MDRFISHFIVKNTIYRSHGQNYNMLHKRKSVLALFIMYIVLPVIILSAPHLTQQNQKQVCECFNGGSCPDNDNYIACDCPQGFIGNQCQTITTQIKNIQKQAMISQGYSYFYFQPKEINYYQMNLKICLPQNQNKKLVNLVFLEIERSSGKLKLQPTIYQTSPISFEGTQDRCQVFATHYIPIRKKMNDQFQKIVFGVAIKNNSDSAANRWVNFLQKSFTDAGSQLQGNQIFASGQTNQIYQSKQLQVQSQKITISCTYQLYIVESYWSTAIIVMSSIILFISTVAFLYTIRSKYSYTISNDDILRLYGMNPQQFANSQPVKNDLSHFTLIMPSMSYELLLQKQKNQVKKYPNNKPKKIGQTLKSHSESQTDKGDQPQTVDVVFDSETTMESEVNVQASQNVCTICLLDFQNTEQVRKTPCKHVFHSECIDNWCQNTLNCPICRQNLQMPNKMTKRQFRALIQN